LGVESKLVTDVSGIVEIEPIPADSDPGSVHTDLHKTIRETNSSCEPHFSVLTFPFLIVAADNYVRICNRGPTTMVSDAGMKALHNLRFIADTIDISYHCISGADSKSIRVAVNNRSTVFREPQLATHHSGIAGTPVLQSIAYSTPHPMSTELQSPCGVSYSTNKTNHSVFAPLSLCNDTVLTRTTMNAYSRKQFLVREISEQQSPSAKQSE
jgi:hypothetical protein